MTYGTTRYGESVYEEVSSAITQSEIIPPDAKKALKDFLNDTFGDLWSSLDDILNMSPPTELLNYWDLLIELVKALM
ncbi:hypothetical protein [Neptuniibacter sp.]|uniref:hypothetical protein n=1 Tax=Neptuniibacter sp. TaxID=1962643 RepID=UPI00261F8617|nr:hypothetical protein [Neptuniibacter sp.]MCP4597576.1 hypothetical protein [Neptuniibacter sp.]